MTADRSLDVPVDIQRDTSHPAPDDDEIRRTVSRALHSVLGDDKREVSIRLLDGDEMRQLNHRYRDRDYATNVLSFPAEFPEELDLPLIGDIAICAPVVNDEAREQGKSTAAHWDHMLVHGVLHLLGYDHENDDEAAVMEALETRVLATLGWPDPYVIDHGHSEVHP